MEEKKCKTCGKVKPVSDFHKAKALASGAASYQSYCKECQREKNTARWASIKDDPDIIEARRLKGVEYRRKLGMKEKARIVVDGKCACSICGETKPVDEFYLTRWGKPEARCKKCNHAKTREYVKRTGYTEANRERRKEWVEQNRDKLDEYHREYAKKRWAKQRGSRPSRAPLTPEKEKERKDARRAYHRKYLKDNPDKRLQFHRRWQSKNADSISAKWKEYNKKRIKSDPEYAKARLDYRRLRATRKRGAEGGHTLAEWEALLLETGNKCLCCGATGKLTRDHIIPITKGGTDDIENIQPLCRSCNSKKSTKIVDYRQEAL